MRTKQQIALGLLLTLAACPTMAQTQKMAIPSYFGPGALWTKLGAAAPRVGVAIINPNSGPGAALRPDYVTQVKATQARGVTVLGYIHTSYGKRPLAEIKSEIETYRRWYGVDGIFLDEVTNDDAGLPYYIQCRAAIRAGHPKAVVIINPGTPVTEGYMAAADVVLTFEHDYASYLKRDPDAAWVAKYPAKRFWHLVYATPDIAAMHKAVALSKKRNAGWVYVTADDLPNPWDTLPEGAYWTGELTDLAHR
ncbi:MAG: spherulation-specific family 4 protein [Janthinobacterium lividum]